MRLQKLLAHAGVASRRKAEQLIAGGRVCVNGRIVRELGTVVSAADRVEVDGKHVVEPQRLRYLVMHKPCRIVTTMHDPQRRLTVASLLPKNGPRIVPVGRLDYDTSGVLLMTNDGDLAYVLTHPRFGIEKTYRAVVRGRLLRDDVQALQRGVRLDEATTAPARIRVVATSQASSEIDITIHEGRNREVRRMLEKLGHPVLSLVRLRFGPIRLGELRPGEVRDATSREVRALHLIAATAKSRARPGETQAAE